MGEHGGRTILHPPIGGRWCRIAHDLQARLECTYQSTVMHGQQAHRLLSCDPWLDCSTPALLSVMLHHNLFHTAAMPPTQKNLGRFGGGGATTHMWPAFTKGGPSGGCSDSCGASDPPSSPTASSTWPGSSKKTGSSTACSSC